jgi:invasion protein IalB
MGLVWGSARAEVTNGQVFEHWTVRCGVRESAAMERCFLFQNVVTRKGGQRVLHVAVGYLPGDESPAGILTLPLGISLPPGASLELDGGVSLQFPIERCEAKGCQAGFRITPEFLEALKTAQEARVTFYDGTRHPIDVKLSLKGLWEGFQDLR